MAQQTVTFSIQQQTKEPIDAATIIISDQKTGKVIANGLTETDGKFNYTLIDGSYQLYCGAIGCRDTTILFSIPNNHSIYNIYLYPDGTELKDVIVTARKQRSLIKMESGKISISVAESYLANLGNSLDVLRHTPNVRLDNKGNLSLSALGNAAVYVNGKRIRLQGETLTAYLRTIPSSNIASITTSTNPDASYDSEGASGIIDIKLKDNNERGLYISTSHGMSFWNHIRQSSDFSMTYNEQTWQLGINYSHNIGHYDMEYGTDRMQEGDRNFSETNDTDKRNTYAGGLAFVFQPNKKHKLMLNTSVDALTGPGVTATTTWIYKGRDTLHEILKARNDYTKQENTKYTTGIGYQLNITEQQTITANADWIHVDVVSNNNQPNAFYSPNGTLLREDNYPAKSKKNINIISSAIDYKLKNSHNGELLTGIKAAKVESNNRFGFYAKGVLDNTRSNRFTYQESNLEGYIQYAQKWKHVQATVGMRIEYMQTIGTLESYLDGKLMEENKNNHTRLFPNLSISYDLNDKAKLTLAYSKRQDKARYEDLNPIEYLLDELTYWKGNPFIQPQINHRVSLDYTKNNLSVTLSYNQLNNYFTQLPDAYKKDCIVMTTKNIGKQKQLALDLIYNKRLTSWWDVSANIGAYYFINHLDYESYREDYRCPSCNLSLSNDIQLPAKVRMELSARYASKRQGRSYEVFKPSGSIDIGLSKRLLRDRLSLSLMITDLLHTERWDSYGRKGALNLDIWGHSESRQVIFRVHYNFGSRKFETNKNKVKEAERL
ncbi:outer membrane beta-barrel family protein [Prevotella sp.]|uniref:outer membrane beta-barrel family protein n=1 Tax=Prevotella sp. TaxID=59823 RepID=UPI00257BB852|nr:outer membrane beta-barrel family protein [Prevotella sp.]